MRRYGFSRGTRFIFLLLGLAVAPQVFGHIRQVLVDSSGSVPYNRSDSAGIQFLINDQIAPGQVSTAVGAPFIVVTASSSPVAAVRAALATWSSVPGSGLKFLPLKSTKAVHDSGDFQHVVSFASTQDLSMLGFSPGKSIGAIAVAFNSIAPADGMIASGVTAKRGDIIDSDIVLNSSLPFSTDGSTGYDIQGVLTHEIGHTLGLNHSGLLGAAMFPYSSITTAGAGATALLNQRLLSSDEAVFASSAYPASGSTGLGTLSGKVVATDGSAVKFALVTLVDGASRNTYNALTGADGSWSQQVQPGSYIVYTEPLTALSIVQAGNIYTSTGSLDPAQVTSNFQPTILGGAATPTSVTVAAGNVANVPNLAVTGGTSSLRLPFVAFGVAGGSGGGDIPSFPGVLGPRTLVSGQSVDIAFLGGGMDGTESVLALGGGITVKAGSVRVFRNSNDPASPLIRITLDVKSAATASLASLFISKPSGSLAISGFLVVVPPKPVFTSKSIVSAASYKGVNGDGAVSPGGIYSIYDIETLTLGPAAFAQPTSFDAYGNLSASLGGVTVTFDGVPAPLYLSYGGQLNLQVPFEVAGKTSTKVVVNFQGSQSDAVSVPVVPAQPTFFTFTPLGTDVITQNFPDYSLNASANPIARGGIVLMYGTGLGKLSYPLATGQPGVAPPAGFGNLHTCSFGGKTTGAFVYWNFGFVGEALWVVTVPADAPTGSVAVTCTDPATGTTTQPGAIFIK
jgi:uncharacterized protein (TIGR03437 family)